MPDPEPFVRSLGQIHITVADLPRAVAFYRDVLGLPLLFEVPEQEMAFLDCGGVRLYLGRAESPEVTSRPLLYLRVDDVEEGHRRLLAHGATILSEPHVVHRDGQTELWMAFFRDPDGTTMALMAEKPAAAAD
ncbi:MAG: VOC family protein [Thermoanaerobaculia bacterium]